MTKPNLLLVDPDERNRRVLEVSLRKAGFMVTLAADGVEAMQRLEVLCPDAIVSEVALPKLDGVELVRQVRRSERLAKVPIVMLGEAAQGARRLDALAAGADDFVTRPVLLKEVIARAKMMMDRRARAALSAGDDQRALSGQLDDMAVIDLIQTMELGKQSGVTQLNGPYGRRGAIYFREGKIIDAELGAIQGALALYRLLIWTTGSFEVELKTIRRKEVISISNEELVMEGMRRMDEWERLCEQLPPLDAVFELDYDTLADRLGEIPDEVNAVIRLFDRRRSLIEVVDDASLGDLEALGVVCKLYFEGLLHTVDEQQEGEDAPRKRRRTQRVGGLPTEPEHAAVGEAPTTVHAAISSSREERRAVREKARLAAEQETMEALSSTTLPQLSEVEIAGGGNADAFGAAAEAAGAIVKEEREDQSATDRYERVDYADVPSGDLFFEASAHPPPAGGAEELPEVEPIADDEEEAGELVTMADEERQPAFALGQQKDRIVLEAGDLLPEQGSAAAPSVGVQGESADALAEAPVAVAETSEPPSPLVADGQTSAAEDDEALSQPFAEQAGEELVKASGQGNEASGEIVIEHVVNEAPDEERLGDGDKEPQRGKGKRKRRRKTRAAGSGQLNEPRRVAPEDAQLVARKEQEAEVDRWLEEEGGARGQLIPFPRGRGPEETSETEQERRVDQAAKEAAVLAAADDPSAASINVHDEAFFASDYESDPFAEEAFGEYPARSAGKLRWVLLLAVVGLAVGGVATWQYVINNKYSDRRTAHLRVDGTQRFAVAGKRGENSVAKSGQTARRGGARVATNGKAPVRQAPMTKAAGALPAKEAPLAAKSTAPTKGAPATVKPVALAKGAPSEAKAGAKLATPQAGGGRGDYAALIEQAQRALQGRKRAVAQKLYLRAQKLQPEGWEVLSFLSWRAYNRGRSKQALEMAKRALARNPNAPYASLVLGAVAHERGDKAAARSGYQRFLSGCARCPEVKDITQALKSL